MVELIDKKYPKKEMLTSREKIVTKIINVTSEKWGEVDRKKITLRDICFVLTDILLKQRRRVILVKQFRDISRTLPCLPHLDGAVCNINS